MDSLARRSSRIAWTLVDSSPSHSNLSDGSPGRAGPAPGGVSVAYEVAKALYAPLGLALVRKIGTSWQPELAIAAVVDGDRAISAGRPRVDLADRTVIVIDDGLATGATMEAALHATRHARPERLIPAIPIAPPDTTERLHPEIDDVVCLHSPALFGAIGLFYREFYQLSDEEVIGLLKRTRIAELNTDKDKDQPG